MTDFSYLKTHARPPAWTPTAAGDAVRAAAKAQRAINANTAATGSAPQPNIYDFAGELLSPSGLLTLPEPDWLIDGWLPTASLMMIYGAPGSFKTFVGLDIAYSVANGLEWHGAPVQAGLVLYIVAEDIGGQQYRQRAWSELHEPVSEDLMRYLPRALNLISKDAVDQAVDWVAKHHPKLIIVDTLHRSTPGADENDSKAMGAAIEACCRMREASAGGSVIFLHHTSKSGERYRGSSALEGDTDSIIKLEKSGMSVSLVQEKMKNAETLKMDLDLEWVDLGEDSKGRQASSLTVAATNTAWVGATQAQRSRDQRSRLLVAVADHPGRTGRAVIATTDIPVRTGLRLLANLEQAEILRSEPDPKNPKGKLWFVVEVD